MKKAAFLIAIVVVIAIVVIMIWLPHNQKAEAQNQTRPARTWNVIYTVKAGDTLSRIANELGTTVKSIVALNSIDNSDLIYIGQELRIDAYDTLKEVNVSWYGPGFDGRPMANGKTFHMSDPTVVAHKYLPFGTKVRLSYGGKSIVVVVQDRGPFNRVGDKVYFNERRDFDLSEAAAEALGIKNLGVVQCRVEIIKEDGI